MHHVNGVWMVRTHLKETLTEFLHNINFIHRISKFTMERENNKNVPFLDVILQVNLKKYIP